MSIKPQFPEEELEQEIELAFQLGDIKQRTDPAAQYIRDTQYGTMRFLAREDITKEVAHWVKQRINLLTQKIKNFESGYDRLNNEYSNLPENPVFRNEPITVGKWTGMLLDEGEFDPMVAIHYSGRKQTLGDSAKELLIFADKSSETGFSTSVASDRMKRAGLDRNTAAAFRIARMFSFQFGRGQITYLLPGGILLVISPASDNTNVVKWRKISMSGEFLSFFKSKNHEEVDPITEDDWDKYHKAVKELLAIYAARIKGHRELSTQIEKLQQSVSSSEGKERKRYLKELSGAVTIEEAFTVSVKRSIEGLLGYMRASIK